MYRILTILYTNFLGFNHTCLFSEFQNLKSDRQLGMAVKNWTKTDFGTAVAPIVYTKGAVTIYLAPLKVEVAKLYLAKKDSFCHPPEGFRQLPKTPLAWRLFYFL